MHTSLKYHFYLASGWFTEAQKKSKAHILDAIENINNTEDLCLKVHDPEKSEASLIYSINAVEGRKKLFESDIDAIRSSLAIIANTEEKDMGTIFECGYAFALAKPIIYYNESLKDARKFNLMLSESGIAIATDFYSLRDAILCFFNGTIDKLNAPVYEVE